MATKNKHLVLWLIGFLILICAVTTASILILVDSGPTLLVKNDSEWLKVRVSGGIKDAPGSEGLVMDPANLPPLSSDLAATITAKATDDGVKGLFLEIDQVGMGWAQVESLRRAVTAFADAGKPCIAWSEVYDTKSYYLASACETVAIAPEGLTLVNGMNVNQSYYAGTIDLLGVSANFEHVGDFKSAVEPYERTGPSEAAQAATNGLLDGLYDHITSGMAVGRGLPPEAMLELIDNPPLTAKHAVERGLVDERVYRTDLITRLEDDGGLLTVDGPEMGRGFGAMRIAVIHADGPIMPGKGGADVFGDSVVGSRSLIKIIEDVAEDDAFEAVVLRVNSPGGSGSASDDIWYALESLKTKKPLVVSMGDYAASGGYYIAMGADRIFAEPTTITGSIGVFGGKMNMAGLLEKGGVSRFEFSRGARSDLLSTMEDFDPEDRALFRSFLSEFYQTFITKAAEGRSMDVDAIHAVAQGRVWTGTQALDHGLVDELGGLSDAVTAAATMAGLPDASFARFPERKDFFEQLMEELSNPGGGDAATAILGLPKPAQSGIRALYTLDRVLAGGGVAAMLPGELTVD